MLKKKYKGFLVTWLINEMSKKDEGLDEIPLKSKTAYIMLLLKMNKSTNSENYA